jgi:hypothetical protein
VLHRLGLARNKLTSFAREFWGVSAHEICDRVRARGIKKKLRADVAAQFRAQFGAPGYFESGMGRRDAQCCVNFNRKEK